MAVIGIIAGLLVAALLGFYIGRSSVGDSQRIKLEYEQRLQQAEQELQHYQQQVSEHFKGTAQLVEQMNENYRAVYLHLADGAQNLAKGEAANGFRGTSLIDEATSQASLPGEDESKEDPVSHDAADQIPPVKREGHDHADSARQAGL